ncbi:MAG: hypothetical protein EOM87_07710, partial [Clostridia bacterium]|nr:hypothetical protein [Clostridia bacterium]
MDSKKPKRLFFNINHKIFYIVSIVVFLLLSALAVNMAWLRTSREARRQALVISDTIALTLNIDLLKDLTLSSDDLQNYNYIVLKSKFEKLVEANENIRFVYLFKLEGDNLLFAVDSEPITSLDYSPPGQEYTEATDAYIEDFKKGISFVTSATTDRWGTWITTVSPIKD